MQKSKIVTQVFDKWRNEKMKLELTPIQVNFIVATVINPYVLPLNSYGLKPYSPGSKDWKKLSSLRKWVIKNLLTDTVYKKGELSTWKTSEENITVGIKDGTGKDTLIEVLKHYEVIGVLTEWVDSYGPLINKLKGETIEIDDFTEDTKELEHKEEKVEKVEEEKPKSN